MVTQAATQIRFDHRMYQAALAYYGLPPDYKRTFELVVSTDRDTGQIIRKKNGEPEMYLRSCNPTQACREGKAVWLQVNIPREDAAKYKGGYPKKADNADIGRLLNVTLDFEYPPEPARAHRVGIALAAYLEEQGLALSGLPVEDSGAGPHIVLPLPAIEITEKTAERWNEAIRLVVEQHIKPEFKRLVEQEHIEMSLDGFDLSRVLSAPGTWRPTNPKKVDCDQLKQGYLRRWLPPYIDGRYPERKESAHLKALIEAAYATPDTPQQPVPVQIETSSDQARWLQEYAAQHPNADRSGHFQSLVNALYLKYDDQAVWALKAEINLLTGEKYTGRLDKEIKRSLKEAHKLPKDDRHTQRTQANGTATSTSQGVHALISPDDVPLPQVVIGGQLRDVTKNALDALKLAEQKKPSIFVQSARLVQVACNEKKRPIIVQMGIPEIKNALTRSANYFREKKASEADGGGFIDVPVSPPKEIAEAILALNPSEWPFPALEAIVETPVMRPDGSILDIPGYDPTTRLYYYPRKDMKACKIPSAPTQENVQAALALIDDAIGEFPYVAQADRANAYACLFTPMLRHAIKRHVPMAVLDAPKQGAGKGLFADTTSIISTGSSSPVLTMSDSEEELQKALTSLLMEGATIITIDNVSGRLQSRHLDAVLTADVWRGRVLGQSRMVMVPQRATWLATGNNVRLGGDLARRCYRIRLDPKVSRPWMRSGFKHSDLATWVTEHRVELVTALLTIARAWFVAGQPAGENIPALGTFTGWAQLIGGILTYAGIEGFLANLEQLYDEADEESSQWEAFFTAWRGTFGNEWTMTANVVEKLKVADSSADSCNSTLYDSLPEYLQIDYNEGKEKNLKGFTIKLGRALEKRVDACFGADNLRLERVKDGHTKGKLWRVLADSADSSTTYAQRKNDDTSTDEIEEKNKNNNRVENYPHYPQAQNSDSTQNGSTSGLNGHFTGDSPASTLSAIKELSAYPETVEGAAKFIRAYTVLGCAIHYYAGDDRQHVEVPGEWTDEEFAAFCVQIDRRDTLLRRLIPEETPVQQSLEIEP